MQPQVLVVGAGPSGLLLALALLKNGVPVRIIEKEGDRDIGERGAGLTPRTLEIEHILGVDNDVLAQSIDLPMIHIHDPNDPYRIARKMPIAESFEPTPTCPILKSVMLGQTRHQNILRKHLEVLDGHVEYGTALVGLEQHGSGVIAEISKVGTDSSKERFAYVVGADGSRSSVRKALGIGFLGETRENATVLLDARMEGIDENEIAMRFWGDPKKAIVSARTTCDPGVYHILFGGQETKVDELKLGDADTATSEFQRVSGRTDIKITEIRVKSEWRPNIRMADRFHAGRVFIIGDAAHAHPPTGGQGLNTSVQDAFNLAWKLALVIKGEAPPTLLDSYESERMPVVAELLKISTGLFNNIADRVSIDRVQELSKTAEQSQAQTQAQTQSKGSLHGGPQGVKARKLSQLDVNYRWSEVVFDERFASAATGAEKNAYGEEGHDTRAGDRAPDAPELKWITGKSELGSGEQHSSRLFDVFSPSLHTFLVFANPSAASLALEMLKPLKALGEGLFQLELIIPKGSTGAKTAQFPGGDIYEDAAGHAFTGYGVDLEKNDPTIVVVRPDAMVGAFATSVVGVEKYVSSVFNSR